MKKLDEIPKKEIFNVPDGYFDNLPGKIEARIREHSPREISFVFRYKLQYVLPIIALLAIGILWYAGNGPAADVESILASVQTEDLITYLNESGVTTDDILENIELDASDLEAIENEVYELNLDAETLDDIVDDLDSENI